MSVVRTRSRRKADRYDVGDMATMDNEAYQQSHESVVNNDHDEQMKRMLVVLIIFKKNSIY